MITSIIVEDIPSHSNRLRTLISKASDFIEVKEVCGDVIEAIQAIKKYAPELVFLDIDLHGNNKGGFELLQKIDTINFDVIFTTAHIDENISEIRRCGLHYVVKPYILPEIEEAIKKIQDKQNRVEENNQIKTLKSNLRADRIEDKVIFINFEGDFFPISIKEILYCFSRNNVVTFVVKTQNEDLLNTDIRRHDVTTSKKDHKNCIEWEKHITMKSLEMDFHDLNFCRIHNTFLVNMMHVKKFVPGANGGGLIKLSNDENLDVSAAGKKEFFKQIGRT